MKKSLQNQYVCDRHIQQMLTTGLAAAIGLIIGMAVLGTAQHFDRKDMKAQQGCTDCHKQEVIKIANYKQYKRFHRSPTAEDKRLAAELKADEYIISQYLTDTEAK